MRHFFRTHLAPEEVMEEADAFFPTLGLTMSSTRARERTFTGPLGTVTVQVKPEGGHYLFVQGETDQMGESRLDRNVKRFFVRLHTREEPRHRITAAY